VLVLANNFVLMFVGWEGVGLCSYLLIGFFFLRKSASDAGKKAFIVNRIGDFGFLLGMFLLFYNYNSLDFATIFSIVSAQPVEPATLAGAGTLTAIALLLFVGAIGKSAQLPLYVWLPDAMEGPTPVSALIHAATMVTAGIYMVARTHVIYTHAPLALEVVAVVGAATALFAATIGLVQTDIKRVLAYSTVSQLGYMFLGLGVGAYTAGIFHLMTHAFFKALLFLGAGSVIHAMSGEQDMNNMGGLRKKIPVTYWTFLLATLAIAGAPGFSGFFSKDEILWKAYSSGHVVLYGLGIAAAALTSFYMFRLVFLTFHGAPRYSAETARKIHESPRSMTIPLTLLALLSVGGGWVGIPAAVWELVPEPYRGTTYFEHFLDPVFAASNALLHSEAVQHAHQEELQLMALAIGVALFGFLLAWFLYISRPAFPKVLAEGLGATYRLLLNKYYVDEVYSAVIVRPLHWLSDRVLWQVFDVEIVDGAVNGAASFARGLGKRARRLQSGNTRSYAAWVVLGAVLVVTLFVFRILS
jgi:NADH-quinone oxidoreductase subunit L